MRSAVLGPLRRTLIVHADGRRDTTSDVVWLQGPSLYVDLRVPHPEAGPDARPEGFAGRWTLDGDLARWSRLVDVRPPGPFPDEGTLRPHPELRDVLVEDGVHEPYVEHWRLPSPPTVGRPVGGMLAVTADGRRAVAVRVAADLGLAVQSGATVAGAHAPGADAAGAIVAMGRVDGEGRWRLHAASDARLVGAVVTVALAGDVLRLQVDDADPAAARALTARPWRVTESEGDGVVHAPPPPARVTPAPTPAPPAR